MSELAEKTGMVLNTPSEQQITHISQTDRFVEMALQSGDMDKLEKMLELKERFDANEAQKAFTSSLAQFKSEGVAIGKDKEVSYSGTFYTHASLGNIISKATPVLSKHGFSHRWETTQTDNIITVKCILTHSMGHSESTQLQSAPDVSGKKNPIQAIASAITYLERYTFLAITGLAVQDQVDDDGAGTVEVEYITEDQQTVISDLIEEVKADKENFLAYCKADSIDKLPVSKYDQAVRSLEAKRK